MKQTFYYQPSRREHSLSALRVFGIAIALLANLHQKIVNAFPHVFTLQVRSCQTVDVQHKYCGINQPEGY